MTANDASGKQSPADGSLTPAHFYLRMSALFLLVLLVGLAGGIMLGRESANRSQDTKVSEVDAVTEVLMSNYYYRPTDDESLVLFANSLEEQAISGMLTSLNDDYTRYLPPAEAEVAADELEGEYGGIGIVLHEVGGLVSVARMSPDSPAARAGVSAGDIVERIDNRPVSSIEEAFVGQDLRGPVGSTVELTLVKSAGTDPVVLQIEREVIVVHQVSWQMIPDTSYMWIAIDIFGDRTVIELDQALAEATSLDAEGIILDLRGNGGGWVHSAQETLGRFLDESAGPAMYEDTTPGRGDELPLSIINGDNPPSSLPLVVLVDEGTASAAEIVAGSLRDYDRALVIGVQTFGKGSVQRIFDFTDGASLRVTVAEWFTPSKGRIQDEGIRPDVVLVATDGSTALGGDPFLEEAVLRLDSGVTRPTDLTVVAPQSTPGQ